MQEPRVVLFAKSLRSGKSRLANVLSPVQRRALMLDLLRHAFAVAIDYAGSGNCTVVSHCSEILDMAASLGTDVLQHSGEGGLNGAAQFALDELRRQGAGDVLLMATDMPRLRVHDLCAIADTGVARRCAVIGADRHGAGTNILFVPAGSRMRVSYGPGSLQRHLEEGVRAAGGAAIYRSAEVGFDIDTPEDLREWRCAAPAEDAGVHAAMGRSACSPAQGA